MKKTITRLSIAALLFASSYVMAQDADGSKPYSFEQNLSDNLTATVSTPAFDYTPLIVLSEQRIKNGTYELTDKLFDVSYDFNNSGTWTTLNNGDRLWKLKISSPGAFKIMLYYQNFYLPDGAKLSIYNGDRSEEAGAYTSKNNEDANTNQGIIATQQLSGDEQIVEYYEPRNVRGQGHFSIFRIAHQFKSIQSAETCQIDPLCPDGANWQNEKHGVVRIYVVIGSLAGYCSGSLVNNTALDCKKYILTAMHCSLDESTGAETTAYNNWIFYFDYEKSGCATGSGTASHQRTGCSKRAGANDGGGMNGSDFLLLEMTAPAFPSGVTPYYLGWTRATTVTAGGVGIHHPQGDYRKISTFTATPTSTTWGGNVANTHWEFVWASGHGSTEPGSSGSPVFNSNHLIFGTLTGGQSCCVANGCGWVTGDPADGPNYPDAYGKMSMHWTSNGTTAAVQVQPWLDPGNTGAITLGGSFSPCVLGVSTYNNESNFNIYPNPNNGSFTISSNLDKMADIRIVVLNILGEQITSKLISNTLGGEFQMDLTTQPQGIYFIEMIVNGASTVKKINVIR